MELRTFVQTLVRRWIVPTVLLAAALTGTFLYHHYNDLQSAQATVAVLDPNVARPAGEGTAQITFDAVITSHRLAERVSARTGLPASVIKNRLTVKTMTLAATIGGLTISPVYKVTGKGKTQSDAVMLTDIAVEEGRLLYLDLNTPDTATFQLYIDAALRSAEAKELSAATDLENFSAAHNATDLQSQIAAARQIVDTLRLEVINAQSDLAAQQATGLYSNIAAAQRRLNSLSASLSNEETKLNQLTPLEAEYNRYLLKASIAQAEVGAVAGAAAQTALAQRPAFPAEVKVLDSAQPESQFLFVLLEFGAGAVIGLLVGATAIYVIALLERPVETAEQVGEAVGAPILVRIPRARR